MKRREFLKLSLGTAGLAAMSQPLRAQGSREEIRIGYQKSGVLVIALQQTALEKQFEPQGIDVKWFEFSSGSPMLEAMYVGSIDYGSVGDSPPFFALSAGAAAWDEEPTSPVRRLLINDAVCAAARSAAN
jgi:sulfonate transport system substrate-binding protein